MPPSLRIWTALVALNLVAAGLLLGVPGVALGQGGPFDGPPGDASPFNVPPDDAPPFNVPPEDRPPFDDDHGPEMVDGGGADAGGDDDGEAGEDG